MYYFEHIGMIIVSILFLKHTTGWRVLWTWDFSEEESLYVHHSLRTQLFMCCILFFQPFLYLKSYQTSRPSRNATFSIVLVGILQRNRTNRRLYTHTHTHTHTHTLLKEIGSYDNGSWEVPRSAIHRTSELFESTRYSSSLSLKPWEPELMVYVLGQIQSLENWTAPSVSLSWSVP
jgi:hypothetical protein